MRRLMSDKSKFTSVGIKSLGFCGVLYVIPSLLIYLAYSPGNKAGLEISDLYYQTFLHFSIVFRILNYLMTINFVYGICSFTIYNMEMLEKIKAVQTFLRDSEGNLRSLNLLVYRILFIISSLLLASLLSDLRLVYAINGIFLNSIIGMIIPGLIGIFRGERRISDNFAVRIGDYVCVLAGVLCIVLFFVDLK